MKVDGSKMDSDGCKTATHELAVITKLCVRKR